MHNIHLVPDIDPVIQQLFHDLDQVRVGNPLILAVHQVELEGPVAPDDYRSILDSFVAQFDYTGLGSHWIEIQRRVARKLLLHVVHEELAYPDETMELAQAEQFVARFLDLFAPDSRFFTNGACSGASAVYTLDGEQVLGWRSISPAPLDNGVIILDSRRVGMIWAEDEV